MLFDIDSLINTSNNLAFNEKSVEHTASTTASLKPSQKTKLR